MVYCERQITVPKFYLYILKKHLVFYLQNNKTNMYHWSFIFKISIYDTVKL